MAAEIVELGGNAYLAESRFVVAGQDEALKEQFVEQVEQDYAQILDDLERDDGDLALLSKRYQQVRTQDYFQSNLGKEVREALFPQEEVWNREVGYVG